MGVVDLLSGLPAAGRALHLSHEQNQGCGVVARTVNADAGMGVLVIASILAVFHGSLTHDTVDIVQ